MTDDLVRALPDWIDGWMEYTANIRSPEHYRLWTGYSIISGVMERRIWSKVSGFTCYPNLYIVLVSRPGIGKSVSIKEADRMWAECRGINIGPNGMTKAALIDHINENGHELMFNGRSHRYYPLSLAADEFGILLPEHNLELLNLFNTLWDSGDGFSDRTRKDGLKVVEKPTLNLIAGTQPDYLNEILPPTAFGMGFTSRIIMVHGEKEKNKKKMFEGTVKPEEIRQKLVHDLQVIQKIVGEIHHTEESERYFEEWYADEELDAPDHPLLENYNTRRNVSIQKLSMIRSMSRNNELIIEREDVEFVHRMLISAEATMPEIFKEMTTSADKRQILEMHRFCFKECGKSAKGTVSEEDLMRYISGKVDVHRAKYFLSALIESGRVKVAGANNPGYRFFKPQIVAE